MLKKVFALASVTALTGLTAATVNTGCTPDDKGIVGPGATADAQPDQKTKPPPPPDDGGEPPEETSCLDTTPIDATQFPYTTAQKSPGACTTNEAKAISDFFKAKDDANEDVLVSEWAASVSKGCSDCVFSDGTGATWTPIISKDDKLDNVNRGGCIEILSGKEACGKSYQQVTECRLEACISKCKTQDEFTSCLQDAEGIFTGPCKDAYDQMEKDCGANLGAYETGCKGTAWTFEGPIKVQCVTGGTKSDAGDGG